MSETLEQIDADDSFLTAAQERQPEQNAGQEAGDTEAAASGEEQAAPEPASNDETPAWLRKRIDRAVAQQRDAERAAQAARDENEQLRRALAHARGDDDQQAPQTPAQIEAEVRARIESESRTSSEAAAFRATGDALANAIDGEAGAGSARAATGRLVDAVGLDFQNADHRQIISDISKLPNAAQVYVALSRNPNAASDIFGASPREQYALLRDFSREYAQPPAASQPAQKPVQVSQAPRPAGKTPAAQRASARTVYDDDVSMDEFVAMRGKKR